MKSVTVLGGGSWGTALAILLAARHPRVGLWVRRMELAAWIGEHRENPQYLPGVAIPANISVHHEIAEAVRDAELVVCAVPSRAVREIFGKTGIGPDVPVITATKGIEAGTLLRISQVISEASGARRIGVLSGPSFASEAVAGYPTAVVVASADRELAEAAQAAFSGSTFRVYTSDDPVGVELGGAYKNVVAIGAGVCHGLGLGHNALAALITRGLAEMTRLAIKIGGKPSTLAGLAGLGDLVLTCTGGLSRNRRVGEELALGRSISEITGAMRMVAEGVGTTHAILKLGQLHGVELPIASQMDAVLHNGRPPRDAIQMLMERSLKHES